MSNALNQWKEYVSQEYAYFTPFISELQYTLDAEQKHIGGERYLMQALTTTSGKKLILTAHDELGARVLIKASTNQYGMNEIRHEHACRDILHRINFAYNVFFSPPLLHFEDTTKHVLSIQQFIPQEKTFLEHTLEEQFTLARTVFTAQENTRATTYGHERMVRDTFGYADAAFYIDSFSTFQKICTSHNQPDTLCTKLAQAYDFLHEHTETIDRYRGFLTHTDFVPHNIRIHEGTIYLLDHASLRFGNKYEGWARFLNFMTLYNPELEALLLTYLRENRIAEELTALKCMRLFRLGEIILFYVQNLSRTEGDLQELTKARISFWSAVLDATLNDQVLDPGIRTTYQATRDTLRSEEEKKRQQGLH